MANLRIRISAITQGLTAGLKSAGNKVNAFGAKVADTFGLTAKRAVLGLVGAMALVAFKSIQAAANFEDISVAFRVMIGDAAKASKVLKELTDFSTRTPFTPDEIFKTAKTLMAFGVRADDVGKKIAFLGDISAGTGKDINELARIYGKAFVKGKVQGEELNQLSEAGIPIIKALQKQYGATAAEIFKMGSQGKLSFEAMESGLKTLTAEGGMFFDMMAQKSETLNGKLSTLKGNLNNVLIGLGNFGTGGGKSMLDRLNDSAANWAYFLGGKTEDRTSVGFMSGSGATTKADILKLRQLNAETAEVTADKLAAQRKEEAAARIGQNTAKSMLSNPGAITDQFLAKGSNIIGGGMGGINVQDQQLASLKEIAVNTWAISEAARGDATVEEIKHWRTETAKAFTGE